jgi:hypothetical protein
LGLRRKHAIKPPRNVRGGRVGELESAGGQFRDTAQRRPMALRQGEIRRGLWRSGQFFAKRCDKRRDKGCEEIRTQA